MIALPLRKQWPVDRMIAALTALPAIFILHDYLEPLSVNFVLGFTCIALSIKYFTAGKSTRLLIPLLLVLLLNAILPVKTTYYLVIAFSCLFLVETLHGRTDKVVILALGMMSPIFSYAVNSFSFPIRLWLTSTAGWVLRLLDSQTTVHGNLISFNQTEYAVDAGCMGLSMMETSLLLVLLLIVSFQHRFRRIIRTPYLALMLLLTVLLNILANLFRIILIVQLDLLPGTFGHELAGIACLVFYVILPAFFLLRYLVRKGKVVSNEVKYPRLRMQGLWLLPLICSLLAIRTHSASTYADTSFSADAIEGYTLSKPEPGILKLAGGESLIYVKYLRGWYDSDHNPMLCWKGSGFEFRDISKLSYGDHQVYGGTLVKGSERLYSAWWYYDGKSATTDPVSWRVAMFHGAKVHSIINVTSSTAEGLEKELKKVLAGSVGSLY